MFALRNRVLDVPIVRYVDNLRRQELHDGGQYAWFALFVYKI